MDLAKGIAILTVLVHHVTNRRFRFGTLEALLLIKCFLAWTVFVFILCSGFLQGANPREESYFTFCVRRAKRLLIPYFTIGAAYLVWFYGVEVFKNPSLGFHAGDLLRRFAGYAFFAEYSSEQMYFLPMLFLVAVIHEGNLRLLSRAKAPAPGLLLVIVGLTTALAVILTATDFPLRLSLYTLSLSLFYYSFGYLLASVPRQRWVQLGVPLSLVGLAVAWGRVDASAPAFAIAIPWVVFWLCTETRRSLPGRALLEYLGRISSFIFIYHSPLVIHPIIRALCRAGLGDWCVIFFSIPLTLVSCAGLHLLVTKWRPLRFLKV